MIDYNKKYFKVCVNCKYWDYYGAKIENLDDVPLDKGLCHRYPANVPCVEEITECGRVIPSMILRDSPLMAHCFTFGCDWCGEFEPDDEPLFPDGIYMP